MKSQAIWVGLTVVNLLFFLHQPVLELESKESGVLRGTGIEIVAKRPRSSYATATPRSDY